MLNHAPKAQDVTRRHYNFAKLEPMVRAALQAWAEHVWMVTGQAAKTSNVIDAASLRRSTRPRVMGVYGFIERDHLCRSSFPYQSRGVLPNVAGGRCWRLF